MARYLQAFPGDNPRAHLLMAPVRHGDRSDAQPAASPWIIWDGSDPVQRGSRRGAILGGRSPLPAKTGMIWPRPAGEKRLELESRPCPRRAGR